MEEVVEKALALKAVGLCNPGSPGLEATELENSRVFEAAFKHKVTGETHGTRNRKVVQR